MKFNWCNEAWDTLKNIEAIVLRSRDVVLSRWLRLVVNVVSKSIADKKGAYVVFLLPAACLESRTRRLGGITAESGERHVVVGLF